MSYCPNCGDGPYGSANNTHCTLCQTKLSQGLDVPSDITKSSHKYKDLFKNVEASKAWCGNCGDGPYDPEVNTHCAQCDHPLEQADAIHDLTLAEGISMFLPRFSHAKDDALPPEAAD